MPWPATIVNSLWVGSSLPAWAGFRRALNQPEHVQRNLLRRLLAANASSAYGRAHGFRDIKDYPDFARRVPLAEYAHLAPWVDRIRGGEPRVLTSERVTHLIPTSGTTGARKLIPFTAGLQRQFARGLGPWLADLALRHPQMLCGPAYWSISPPPHLAVTEPSKVPVGFADDASYLGGIKRRLVRAAMVVPDGLGEAFDLETFRWRTLLGLLRQRDLRLISVWHPSFLTLLLDALPGCWERILAQLQVENRPRFRELEQADPGQPGTLWPHLAVLSCWGNGNAELPLADLRRRFPGVFIQPKGLLATEAFVTIPFGQAQPAAVGSHFFEFIDPPGQVHPLHQLRKDETYEVVVTTAGGLWRYRMQDQVRVTGFVGKTPALQFVGRAGNVSDLFGEKLSESFVAHAISQTLSPAATPPRFVLLAPDQNTAGWHYTLYVEGAIPLDTAEVLDRHLRLNPNYRHCRDLGQLQAVEIFSIKQQGFECFARRLVSEGQRLGDLKPVSLCRSSGWSKVFIAGSG